MLLRPFVPSDLPTLLALTVEVFGPFYEGSYRPVVGDVVFRNRHGRWQEDYRRHLAGLHDPAAGRRAVVAQDAGGAVGFVGWVVRPDERHGEIDLLAVAPTARRRGVGAALLRHALDDLRAAGVEVVSVGTGGDDFHAPARALYEAEGFTPYPNVHYTLEL